jgi:hypothetical protein
LVLDCPKARGFPNTIPVVRPLIPRTEVPHPEWMAGFITGEGCFFIKLNPGLGQPMAKAKVEIKPE